jgi:hypothetical protein
MFCSVQSLCILSDRCVTHSRRCAVCVLQVLEGDKWTANLPYMVEAVFYPTNAPRVDAREGDAARAHAARAAFVAHFPGAAPTFPPVLTYDVAAARRGDAPWAKAV